MRKLARSCVQRSCRSLGKNGHDETQTEQAARSIAAERITPSNLIERRLYESIRLCYHGFLASSESSTALPSWLPSIAKVFNSIWSVPTALLEFPDSVQQRLDSGAVLLLCLLLQLKCLSELVHHERWQWRLLRTPVVVDHNVFQAACCCTTMRF